MDRERGRRLLVAAVGAAVLVLLALPLGSRVSAGATAARFLVEFLTEGRRPWLSRGTRPPRRVALLLAGGGTADLWLPPTPAPYPGLVLVHGLTPEGKDDPRLTEAAALLARAGFAVSVPELPSMRAQRLRPEDADQVAAAVRALSTHPAVHPWQLALLSISVGLTPALRATADPEVNARVRLLVSLGGHAEARELVRYFTTGHYAFGNVTGRGSLDPALTRTFVGENLDLVRDPADRALVRAALAGRPLPAPMRPEAAAVLALLENRDPARVDALLTALGPETGTLLDAVSPARDVRRYTGRLLLVHGRGDPAIPHTESLRLAAVADRRRTRLVLVDLLAHVEARPPAWRQLADLVRLWSAVYELVRG